VSGGALTLLAVFFLDLLPVALTSRKCEKFHQQLGTNKSWDWKPYNFQRVQILQRCRYAEIDLSDIAIC